jgi:hypothetical protein
VSTPPSGGERCWRSPNFEWHALCEPLALRALAQLVKLSERGRARSGRPHPATFLTRGSDSRTNAERGSAAKRKRRGKKPEVLRRDPKVLRSTSEYFGPERTKRHCNPPETGAKSLLQITSFTSVLREYLYSAEGPKVQCSNNKSVVSP